MTDTAWHIVLMDRFPWTRNQFAGDTASIGAAIVRWENEIDADLPHNHKATAQELVDAIRWGSRMGRKTSADTPGAQDVAAWIRDMRIENRNAERAKQANEGRGTPISPEQAERNRVELLAQVRGWLSGQGATVTLDGMRRLKVGETIDPADIIEIADGTRKTWHEHLAQMSPMLRKHAVPTVGARVVVYRKAEVNKQ